MIDFDSKPLPFKSESDARAHAATHLREVTLSIIHSPHPQNRAGDFFIDAPSTIIRTHFETLLFEGAGKNANAAATATTTKRTKGQ